MPFINNNIFQNMQPGGEVKKMEINREILDSLNKTRKWTMFLSVMGFIIIGLLIAMILVTGTFLSFFKLKETSPAINDIALILALILIAVAYSLSVVFLFRFSRFTRDAIHNQDIRKLDKAFKNLKLFFSYIGIILIIALALYLLTVIRTGSALTFLIGI